MTPARRSKAATPCCTDGAVPMEVDGQPNGIGDHGPPGGMSEPSAARLKHVTAAMDLLRELGSVHLSLRLMAASDIVASLAACARHPVRD